MKNIIEYKNIPPVLYAMLYVIVAVYMVFSLLGKPLTGADDANIFFEYSRNFAHGNGIVYNIGGEHVEGFSSVLYFLLCSFFYLFSDSPEAAILIFNGFLSITSCVFIFRALKLLAASNNIPEINSHIFNWIYLIWLLINPSYFAWTVVSLMDSGVYSFLLLVSYSYFISILLRNNNGEKEAGTVSILIFLIVICRPEGMLWGMVYLFVYFLVVFRIEKQITASIKKTSRPILAFIITEISLTLFRLIYFGYPLPNTYYTKVSASLNSTLQDGWAYFSDFMAMYGMPLFLPTSVLAGWLIYSFLSTKERTALFYVSLITVLFILVGIAIPILEGGDHFPYFRFYQNVYPFFILPIFCLLIIFLDGRSFKQLLISAATASGLLLYFNGSGWEKFMNSNDPSKPIEDKRLCMLIEFNIAKNARENGKRLNDFFKGELPVIGYGSAGGIANGYDGTVYDMMGLNNTKMSHADELKIGPKGHQSFNNKVFFELAPDILMPTAEPAATPIVLSRVNEYYSDVNGWDNLIFKNIFNDAAFKKSYTLAVAYNSLHPDFVCYGYFNNHYLQKMSQKGNFKIQKFEN